MNVVTKTTNELSGPFLSEYTEKFNCVFSTRFTVDDFIRKYRSPVLGYSVHSVALDDQGQIAGMNTIIPIEFEYLGKRVIWGLNCDTFVVSESRGDLRMLVALLSESAKVARAHGVELLFGIPNENSYLCFSKLMRWQDIGLYEFYALPIRMGNVIGKWKWLNPLSVAISGGLVFFGRCVRRLKSGPAAEIKPIRVLRSSKYWDYRLQQGKYEFVRLSDDEYYVYRNLTEFGARCSYIVDYQPRSNVLLEKAVQHIHQTHGSQLDLILFVGQLESPACNLVRIPPRFRPRKLRQYVKVLSGDYGEALLMKHWELGIILMDTR
jgi:hypothetical protein